MLVIDGKYNSEDGRIRRIKSLRGLSVENLRRDNTECACEDSAEAQKSKNPLGIRK